MGGHLKDKIFGYVFQYAICIYCMYQDAVVSQGFSLYRASLDSR